MDSVPQASLVQCAITDRTPDFSLKVWSGMFKVARKPTRTTPLNNQQNLSTRGQVTEFSRKSRKRMIEALAQKEGWQRGMFWTVTYPDEIWFTRENPNRDMQRDLEALRKRLVRQWPGVGSIWRKEWTARKSGAHLGKIAAHIHLLIDGIMDDMAEVRRWLRRTWHEILTDGRCDLPKQPRVDAQPVSNARHAMHYVSKYAGKTIEDTTLSQYFLNYSGDVGRHWGVFGQWERTVLAVTHLTRKQYLALRRYARKSHQKRGRAKMARFLASPYQVGFIGFWGAPGGNVFEGLIGRLLMHILDL